MSYDTFANTEPGTLVISLLISLALTVAFYCAIPLLMAKLRKTPVTGKKYRTTCYLANLAVFVLLAAINGDVSSVAPYFLWTTVFAGVGCRKLEKRGLLLDAAASATQQSAAPVEPGFDNTAYQQSYTPVQGNRPRFCMHCGQKLSEKDKFCQNCGARL